MLTDIYRIKTMNSIYEIQVKDNGISRCRRNEEPWLAVKSTTRDYLEKLVIGASFDVPGVVLTSVVQDYTHFTPSGEPKRVLEKQTTIPEFFQVVVDHVKEQANPKAVRVEIPEGPRGENIRKGLAHQADLIEKARVYKGYGPGCSETNHVGSCTCDLPPTCKVPGCDYSSKYGPGHDGARMCKSGSIASGGTRAHCACDYCY